MPWMLLRILPSDQQQYIQNLKFSVKKNNNTWYDGVFIIPPASAKLKRGYTGFTSSIRPSVHLSVCGQNHVCSVSSTILAGSISCLHILSSNFRRCVACKACFKIEIFANSLNL